THAVGVLGGVQQLAAARGDRHLLVQRHPHPDLGLDRAVAKSHGLLVALKIFGVTEKRVVAGLQLLEAESPRLIGNGLANLTARPVHENDPHLGDYSARLIFDESSQRWTSLPSGFSCHKHEQQDDSFNYPAHV